ncbi:MAG: NAD-dependent malic enzyme [Acidimicrobiales bacterium]
MAGRSSPDPSRIRTVAFTNDERESLGLRGLLPWRVTSIEEQMSLELEHLRRKSDDIERYIGLAALRGRNETLFFRLLVEHLEELAPIVYTPTVGRACREFSHVMRRPRGLWITPEDIDHIPELLHNSGQDDVRLIVATDNERILGLGDQGAGGMGIPIGKLELYTAGAGVHPNLTLPISLDCGTDNEDLRDDPLYLGYPKPRLRGAAYDEFIEAFVEAVIEVHPHALLQWEDFKQQNAFRLLNRYRDRLASFNDDIEGTAAVVLGGILAALRQSGERLVDQRLVFLGAGAACIGIARLVRDAMIEEGISPTSANEAIVLIDSHGPVTLERGDLDEFKREFAISPSRARTLGIDLGGSYELDDVVARMRPTILIGATGVPGSFTERALRAMSQSVDNPIVFALSNPTANCEATPEQILDWTDGRALVATGSPFDPVEIDGRTRIVGQANNVYVFPGIGLGAIVTRTREMTGDMFLAAAKTLSLAVTDDRLAAGAIYPPLDDLRTISRRIAIAVAERARDAGRARIVGHTEIEHDVDAQMWFPDYQRDITESRNR